MKQKILKSLLLIASLLAGTNASAYDFEVNGIYYNKNSDGISVRVTYKDTNYNSYSGEIIIPETVTHENQTYSVIYVGYDAFRGCIGLNSIAIPNSVTVIDNSAFQNCRGLTSVEIPNSVKLIGHNAFYGCIGLTSIEIPNSVTYIGNFAFSGCSGLTSVDISDSMTSIGDYTFWDCSGLISIEIPNSVTSIGDFAFSGCSNMISIDVPNSVTSIGSKAFEGCENLANVYIADIAKWCEIKFSDYLSNPLYNNSRLFLNKKRVRDLVIPEGVTLIGDYAFYNCTGLTSVEIPNSVTTIGRNAFEGCENLTAVYITDIARWCKIKFGGYFANPLYYSSQLYLNKEIVSNLVIPDGVISIRDYTFYNFMGLTSVEIPNSVTSIGSNAFEGCENLTAVYITDIARWCEIKFSDYLSNPLAYSGKLYLNKEMICNLVIPDGVTSIRDYTFYNCLGLTSVEIPNSVTSIGDFAFEECIGLTSIKIPNSVISIGNSTFFHCADLTSIVIPNSVILIGSYAFSDCIGLTSVTIGENVETIGKCAFGSVLYEGSPYLSEINSLNPIPPFIESDTFSGVDKNTCVLNVPLESKTEYELELYWKDFLNINEKDFNSETGIVEIEHSNNEMIEVGRYTIDGQLIDKPQRGINIVRYSDGSVRKVCVK